MKRFSDDFDGGTIINKIDELSRKQNCKIDDFLFAFLRQMMHIVYIETQSRESKNKKD